MRVRGHPAWLSLWKVCDPHEDSVFLRNGEYGCWAYLETQPHLLAIGSSCPELKNEVKVLAPGYIG